MTTTIYTIPSLAARLKEFVMMMAETVGIHSGTQRLERLFSEYIRIHDAMIRRICLGYARTDQDLEDLYQDVLVNIWRGLPNFREDSSVRTWIYRITLNTCVSSIRLRSRSVKGAPLDNVIEIADDSQQDYETIKELYECIATLNALDKAILMLWLDEYSYEEIAEVAGLSRNSVATRLHRTKDKLRRKYL